jgi:hypothetical protein
LAGSLDDDSSVSFLDAFYREFSKGIKMRQLRTTDSQYQYLVRRRSGDDFFLLRHLLSVTDVFEEEKEKRVSDDMTLNHAKTRLKDTVDYSIILEYLC